MWTEMLQDETIDEELKDAIRYFFIPDKIDFSKFMNNFIANKIYNELGNGVSEFLERRNAGLINEHNIFIEPEILEELKNSGLLDLDTTIVCTPTYSKYYSENGLTRLTDLGEWFYIAYPDVAKWFEGNEKSLVNELRSKFKEYFEGIYTLNLYRFIVSIYKREFNSLECASDNRNLYFEDITSRGLSLTCSNCNYKVESANYVQAFDKKSNERHPLYAFQCQTCGNFQISNTRGWEHTDDKCINCSGELRRDKPLFCPVCKSQKM